MDFQKLRAETSKIKKKYEQIYKPLRDKVFAHKNQESITITDELFGKTNIGQIQDILFYLYQIEKIISDLFHNGNFFEIGYYKFEDEVYSKRCRKFIGEIEKCV